MTGTSFGKAPICTDKFAYGVNRYEVDGLVYLSPASYYNMTGLARDILDRYDEKVKKRTGEIYGYIDEELAKTLWLASIDEETDELQIKQGRKVARLHDWL